jgi:hypothetical protein
MTQEERKLKIIELSKQILELKLVDSSISTKQTIQKLQQDLSKLTNDT